MIGSIRFEPILIITMMDTAFVLKEKFDEGLICNFEEAFDYIHQSHLINDLLKFDFECNVLNLMNRLNELSEIPFTRELPQVKLWLDRLVDLSFCDEGFSVTDRSDDILSCYNSMITNLLIKMRYHDESKIRRGIQWILKYQKLERNEPSLWHGSGVQKYGGCLKTVPCYIGVVKAVIALSTYQKSDSYVYDLHVEDKLGQGLEYILEHRVCLRKSNDDFIQKYMGSLSYPFSWKTNIVELLRLLKENNLLNDSRTEFARGFLLSKKKKNGFWSVNSCYLPKHWVMFDKPKQIGFWISHEIEKLM